ncbi:HD-GYP domain-containing protein [Gorillibacterium timonense]|uniref:HD-GYP domain-containing protein n=1 Tax=Gorillibacterium timonense TaxID=1689269 RepID=UPI00071DA4AD|nr:HD-GYP domain-containing protein [Gorillibacterium timonense]
MRLVSTRSCKPGAKLGKPIYNEVGQVLLGKDVELTERLLHRLEEYGVHYFYIEDPLTEDVVIEGVLSDDLRREATQTVRSEFRKLMNDTLKTTKSVNPPDLANSFRPLIHSVIDELTQTSQAMIMLTDMHVTDHYLYQHSLNVCLYATQLGMSYGYNRNDLYMLSLGALMHDIGKTKISRELLLKPGKLTADEYEEVKKHAEIGFDILRGMPNIPLLSAHCAFQHHERLDGSGYPRGLKGEDIHDFARWVGIVDVFDAMTTHRVYRKAMLPHEAVDILYAGSMDHFDRDKLSWFRDKIAIYPLGIEVTLSTGEIGVVVDLNANIPHRPIVRIVELEESGPIAVPYEVDLSKKLSVMITDVNRSKLLGNQRR